MAGDAGQIRGAPVILTHPAPMLAGETLAQYRQIDHRESARRIDGAFASALVESFPVSWSRRLLARWGRDHASDAAAANIAHLRHCTAIESAHRAGVKADANDSELCQEADETARDMGRRLDQRALITPADWPEGVKLLALWAEAQHWCESRGLPDLGRLRGRIASILARAKCARWWRRVLRKMHARAVEATARAIGLVHKRAGCYVSDDGARRRRGQLARNAAALESVTAINEHGQEHTLAELAARSTANKEIRRHELMTRIAGFELIAKESGHAAYFVTVTCPSRMHAWRTAGPRVEANQRHDGTTPDQAQRYLTKQWAKFRAAADRAGLQLYGFRIAEPNHDATPHWHCLLFFPGLGGADGAGGEGSEAGNSGAVQSGLESAANVALSLLRRYFLDNESPSEAGAERHRVKVERIDWQRGSAAGYVAKYVAKNIDGNHVGRDLYGNDAFESSQRVEAWAATWRIRQFQQIGGAPVGVWRELRRLHPEQAGAAPAVALALDAVNIAAQADKTDAAHDIERATTAAHGWAGYLMLQGGHRVKRAALRLGLLREATGEIGRYGEAMPARAVGVVTTGVHIEQRPAFGIVPAHEARRTITSEVESERCDWVIVPRGSAAGALPRIARPWSPVNNCTRPIIAPAASLFRQSVERTRKRGRWANWKRAGCSNGDSDHAPQPENHRQ